MCDVCRTEGLNWKFLNGPKKDKLQSAYLFGIYKNRTAKMKLCHIHAIELFMFGEHQFLLNYSNLCQELLTGKVSTQSEDEFAA